MRWAASNRFASRGRRVVTAGLCAATVSLPAMVAPAWAQTSDPLFGGWGWPQRSSARGAGAGGTFIVLPDDLASAGLNPAALGTLDRKVQGTAALNPRERRLVQSALAVKMGCRWTIGGYWEDISLPHEIAAHSFPDGRTFEGDLNLRASEMVLAGAITFNDSSKSTVVTASRPPRLTLGFAGNWTHLQGRGTGRLRDARNPTTSVGIDSAGDIRFSGTVALGIEMAGLSASVVARTPASWGMTRRSTASSAGDPELFRLRAPAVVGIGVRLPVVDKPDLSAQLVVEMSHRRPLDFPGVSGFSGGDAPVEPRLGVEVSRPIGCWSGCGVLLQLRTGLRRPFPSAVTYSGPDPISAFYFRREPSRWEWSIGGSVAGQLKLPFRLDLAAVSTRPATLLVGLSLRYPTPFR